MSLVVFQGHTQAVRSLAFSPDGKWLASASDDCTVKVQTIAHNIQTETAEHAALSVYNK